MNVKTGHYCPAFVSTYYFLVLSRSSDLTIPGDARMTEPAIRYGQPTDNRSSIVSFISPKPVVIAVLVVASITEAA